MSETSTSRQANFGDELVRVILWNIVDIIIFIWMLLTSCRYGIYTVVQLWSDNRPRRCHEMWFCHRGVWNEMVHVSLRGTHCCWSSTSSGMLYAFAGEAQITNKLVSIDCPYCILCLFIMSCDIENTQHQGIRIECTVPPRRILALISVKHHAILRCYNIKTVGIMYTTLIFVSFSNNRSVNIIVSFYIMFPIYLIRNALVLGQHLS